MNQEEVTNDEQAIKYFQDLVNNDASHANNHVRFEVFNNLRNNYYHAIIGLHKSVPDAIQHALDIDAELKRQANERT